MLTFLCAKDYLDKYAKYGVQVNERIAPDEARRATIRRLQTLEANIRNCMSVLVVAGAAATIVAIILTQLGI